jgi:hypothetical protein
MGVHFGDLEQQQKVEISYKVLVIIFKIRSLTKSWMYVILTFGSREKEVAI